MCFLSRALRQPISSALYRNLFPSMLSVLESTSKCQQQFSTLLHSFVLQYTSSIRHIFLIAHNLSPKKPPFAYLHFFDSSAHKHNPPFISQTNILHCRWLSACLLKKKSCNLDKRNSAIPAFHQTPVFHQNSIEKALLNRSRLCRTLISAERSSSTGAELSCSWAPELIKQMKQLNVIKPRCDKGIK